MPTLEVLTLCNIDPGPLFSLLQDHPRLFQALRAVFVDDVNRPIRGPEPIKIFLLAYTSEEFSIVNQSVNCTAINNPVKRSAGVDDTTLAMMKKIESFIPSPKSDNVIGKITVGYGHVCQKTNCTEVTFPFPLSPSFLLSMDLLDRTKCVNANTGPRVILNDNQFGAPSSFVFNAGCDALTTSTLLTRLNNGEDPNTVAA
ncbi:hypothetical protein C8J57DRAFT_1617942 [Mycena rebaudengoi]|nr:hypothetical protein C8J57DRAFT_1617942 [Mycena rebaudengoi]